MTTPESEDGPSQVEIEEQIHFSNVVQTFEQYGQYALSANNRRRKDLFRLSLDDTEVLKQSGVWEEYMQKLAKVDDCILKNASFLKMIVADAEIFEREEPPTISGEPHDGDDGGSAQQHSHSHSGPSGQNHDHHHSHSHQHSHPYDHATENESCASGSKYRPTDLDFDKLLSTLKQLVRDWSEEGKVEREAAYVPMCEALEQHFDSLKVSKEDRAYKQVLVPGAGLGRLVFETACLGFSCQGNEFSHYMLLPSFHILNRTSQIGEITVYPYIHSFSNNTSEASLLRTIKIPDALPSSIPKNIGFSYVAGDFEEVYGAVEGNPQGHEVQDGQWDCIMTCFFIDTAKNIVNYLRIIHRLLAPDGVWINMGPLLWHFENNTTDDTSIELDLAEVKKLASAIGFVFKNERMIKSPYVSNRESLLNHTYDCAFWTATKKPLEAEAHASS